jgi:hypothetical protein
VLTVSGSKVGLKLCPILVSKWCLVPTATDTHEVPSSKYGGVANVDLMWVYNKDAPYLRIVCTILNLLEQGFNRLLGIPCSAHLFKVVFKIHRGDVAIGGKEMVEHVTSGDVGKANHVIIQNFQVHWFKNIDALLFKACCTEV